MISQSCAIILGVLFVLCIFFICTDAIEPDSLFRRIRPGPPKPLPLRWDSINGSDMADANWEKLMRKPSPQKCCKIGERVARNKMTCVFDMHAVSKKNNNVHKAKLKLHGPEVHGKTFGKDIALHVSKCHRHKAVFEKCCSYRAQFVKAMDECRQLKGISRRTCRKQVRQQYYQ